MCVTGNKTLDLVIGVALVAVTAGMAAPVIAPVAGASMTASLGASIGSVFTSTALSYSMATAIGAGTMALGGQLLMGLLTPDPPSDVGYTPVTQYNQQQNTNIATTGSGGRQAAKSLATAISRTKKRKLTQDDVGDLSLSTESFTNTGLQLA